jgi:hypothetical protein
MQFQWANRISVIPQIRHDAAEIAQISALKFPRGVSQLFESPLKKSPLGRIFVKKVVKCTVLSEQASIVELSLAL